MRTLIGAAIAVFAVAMLIVVTQLGTGEVRADIDPATIDFEAGLSEGDIVSSVSCGTGMTCTADPGGFVGVFGDSADPGIPGNAAMIFDAECSGGCSGGDDDLFFPGQGNILIITEDEDAGDPDDADLVNAFFEFDFSTWGPGTVCVDSIDVGDVEARETGAKVELFPGPTVVNVPDTGDNVIVSVPINVCGVDFMRVTLNGSGAIDNIEIELPPKETPTPTPTPTPTSTPTPTPPPSPTPAPSPTPQALEAVALPDTGGSPSGGSSSALSWLAAIVGGIALLGAGSGLWLAYQRRRVR